VKEQRPKLKDSDLQCLGHLRRVFPLLERLHEVGCKRDRAGNRQLFFDDYFKLVLLYVWNPAIQSIADLQQAAALPRAAKTLGVKRFSAGSFSESAGVFDPEQLPAIIEELAAELSPAEPDPRLKDLQHTLTLVDGTVLRGLTRLVKSAVGLAGRYNTSRDGKPVYGWRLHTQFDLATFRPIRIDRTGARNGGEQRENNVLRQHLQAGRCYVGDCTYSDQSLLDDIHAAQSSYVMRGADRGEPAVLEERSLSQAARAAGVMRDCLVQLNPKPADAEKRVADAKSASGEQAGAKSDGEQAVHQLRRVELQVEPHPRRTRSGVKQSDKLVLYTNLLDLEPELIGLIYRYRYTVELFFRIFKQLLGMRHLLSQREEGIDIQIYAAVMVCLLIQLISGKKPNKAMRNMIGWYLLGLADEQDVINFLNKPDNRGVKLTAKEALWKKLGF
jgi:hypothetical protein